MSKFIKPKPIENEIILDPSKVIMSKTDQKGIIMYANDYFMEICGYEEFELMGKPHNVIRHPDMPKVIFKFIWEKLHKGENVFAIVKNLAKDGSYYWVMTTFETTFDDDGKILYHYARRKAIPSKVKKKVAALYKKIKKIENQDEKVAEKYLYGYLENLGIKYDQAVLSLLEMTGQDLNQYFLNTEINTNINTEDIVLEIDFDHIEQKTKKETSSNEIDQIKNKIAKLQEELSTKQNKDQKNKGFFKHFFPKDD